MPMLRQKFPITLVTITAAVRILVLRRISWACGTIRKWDARWADFYRLVAGTSMFSCRKPLPCGAAGFGIGALILILMHRRNFLQLAAAAAVRAAENPSLPDYHVVTPYAPSERPGMPGPYPGRAVRVHSEKCIDVTNSHVDVPTVRQMMSDGIRTLTHEKTDRDAWAHFIDAKDVVGIKLNCSGAPNIRSAPEVVGVIVDNLVGLGVPPHNIYLYERFLDQLTSVHYE